MELLGWGVFALLALLVLFAILGSFFTVNTAQVAVITRFGKFLRVANPGLNWKWPFIDSVTGRVSLRVNQITLTMVKSAMNDINAAQREQVAATARGEAEKILVVKKAEAEAESEALQGQGIANQRKAIIQALQTSIEQFQKVVGNASTSEVMQLVMVTQYFDTLKSIGESDRTNTLFLSHSPGAVKDISDQVLQSMLIAERAKS